MAEAVVSYVVQRLGDLLSEKAKSLNKVANLDKIRRLERELKRMRCFLKDADARQDHDERVQNWVAEIRELAYDAEEIIDAYELKVNNASRKKIDRFVNKTRLFGEGKVLHRFGSQIDKIIERLSELTNTLQAYGIRELKGRNSAEPLNEQQRTLRRTFSHVVERNIVGLEEEAQKILPKLLGEERGNRIVSICGMGGLGKTTLAKMVYHHQEVRHYFDRFAWAYISQQWQVRDVWEGILIRLTSPSMIERQRISKLRDDELAKELYEFQMMMKCLIVLDDIWSEDAWDSLNAGFPEAQGNCLMRSKILLTSRNVKVALHANPNGFFHQPRCLSEIESWELFMRTTIVGREQTSFKFDKHFEELGREMVARCGGLPLAIKVLGGLLATKHTFDEWNEVHDDIRTHMRDKDQVKEIFDLSYKDLPYHLKLCFLHFAHYPEEYMIPARKVIEIWVAEGFIPTLKNGEERKEMEDIARTNLEELVLRCMIQVEKRNSMERIKTCNIHDVMRDLCIHQAKKEGFIQILQNRDSSSLFGSGKVRRLALLNGLIRDSSINYKRYTYIRSLMEFSIDRRSEIIIDSIVISMVKSFKLLRVLDLEKIECSIPEEIGELIHLRLLDLSSTRTQNLPSSIGKLSHLLTLKLEVSKHSGLKMEIPNTLEKLKQLRHLYLPMNISSKSQKLNLANMENLQTLVKCPISLVDPEEFVKLMRTLRKLKMSLKSEDSNIFQNWKDIVFSRSPSKNFNIRSLSLYYGETGHGVSLEDVALCCPNLCKLNLEGQASLTLYENPDPQGRHILQNLTKLSLWRSYLSNDPMPSLGKLPSLTILILGWSALRCNTIFCPRDSFPRLQSLVLTRSYRLEDWTIEQGALCCLQHLEIDGNLALKAVPEGLKFITSLRELEIKSMPNEFTNELKRGGRDFYKIQHVPIIRLDNESVDGELKMDDC